MDSLIQVKHGEGFVKTLLRVLEWNASPSLEVTPQWPQIRGECLLHCSKSLLTVSRADTGWHRGRGGLVCLQDRGLAGERGWGGQQGPHQAEPVSHSKMLQES